MCANTWTRVLPVVAEKYTSKEEHVRQRRRPRGWGIFCRSSNRDMDNKVSKMRSRITGRGIAEEARTRSTNILMNMRDRRLRWLEHILRMDEDRIDIKYF